jgi:hypothetical protein
VISIIQLLLQSSFHMCKVNKDNDVYSRRNSPLSASVAGNRVQREWRLTASKEVEWKQQGAWPAGMAP